MFCLDRVALIIVVKVPSLGDLLLARACAHYSFQFVGIWLWLLQLSFRMLCTHGVVFSFDFFGDASFICGQVSLLFVRTEIHGYLNAVKVRELFACYD